MAKNSFDPAKLVKQLIASGQRGIPNKPVKGSSKAPVQGAFADLKKMISGSSSSASPPRKTTKKPTLAGDVSSMSDKKKAEYMRQVSIHGSKIGTTDYKTAAASLNKSRGAKVAAKAGGATSLAGMREDSREPTARSTPAKELARAKKRASAARKTTKRKATRRTKRVMKKVKRGS